MSIPAIGIPKWAAAYKFRPSLKCPVCRGNSIILDKREVRGGTSVWRRRVCENGHRFSTREQIALAREGRK